MASIRRLRNGYEAVVKLLLAAGADTGAAVYAEKTPLHCASSNGHEGVVEMLLAAGACKEAKDKSGAIPLQLALNPAIDLISPKRTEL